MFQAERVPVRIFKSTDEGAPKLDVSDGAFKTVLKACLVTGYGEGDDRKEGLGWEILEETESGACFRSKDEKSPKSCLVMNGTKSDYYKRCYARFDVSETPAAPPAYQSFQALSQKQICEITGLNGGNNWMLIGNSRAFWLLIASKYERYQSEVGYKTTPCAQALFFGDFLSAAPFDVAATALMAANPYEYYLNANFYDTLVFAGSPNGGGKVGGIPRALMSYASNNSGAVEDIAGEMVASPFYLFENTKLRGKLPGLVGAATYWYSGAAPWEQHKFNSDNDDYILFTVGQSQRGLGANYLINATAWEM